MREEELAKPERGRKENIENERDKERIERKKIEREIKNGKGKECSKAKTGRNEERNKSSQL
jgi:hypothetical protein